MQRLTLIFIAAALAFALAAAKPGTASAAGGDTTAIAVNTKDGSSLFKFAFAIKRVAGDVVDNTNAAVAYASCTACQTVAISIQVVLVTGDPSVVTPENYAIAINQLCTLCETMAAAYQYVFSTGGQVHFTAEGNQALADLRREFEDLRKSADSLTLEEIQARITDLTNRLVGVLQNELVAAGKSGANQQGTETQPPPTPTSTDTTPTTTSTQPTTSTSTDTTPTTTGTSPTDTTTTTNTTPTTSTTTTP